MIYMDNAATTRVTEEVFEAIKPYFTEIYGNPSSVHCAGRVTRKACENARRQVARVLNAEAREIYFTSGGSEADTWAIIGSALEPHNTKRTFITSRVEHKAVLNAAAFLARNGYQVKYIPVDKTGRVDTNALREMIDDDTFLVSVMAANNEVGTIQPINEIADIAHAAGSLFHTDAVQAAGALNIDVKAQNIDMLSLSGHKLHAPKGIGALYVKEGISLSPTIFGGSQERGKRGGTENLPGIIGLGKAIEIAASGREENRKYVSQLRDVLEDGILQAVPGSIVNGDKNNRLPGTTNISFMGVDGEALLLSLDLKNVAVSAGSACTSGSVDPSHVLLSMGLTRAEAQSSVRFSLNEENTQSEVDEVIAILKETVSRLRDMAHVSF